MDQALLDGEAIVWPPNRLTLRKKLAFAIGGTPAQVSGTVIGFFLTPFLLDVVGMRALNVAHILLVARICDAFSDPLVGWLTDRTKSRCAAAGASLCRRAIAALSRAWVPQAGAAAAVAVRRAAAVLRRLRRGVLLAGAHRHPARHPAGSALARRSPPALPAACPQLLGLRG